MMKFSIITVLITRYHISIIIKSMWDSAVHKHAIIQESHSGKNFIKFINMMMNDTTFLLDESLDALKRIHDVQVKAKIKENTCDDPAAAGGHG